MKIEIIYEYRIGYTSFLLIDNRWYGLEWTGLSKKWKDICDRGKLNLYYKRSKRAWIKRRVDWGRYIYVYNLGDYNK